MNLREIIRESINSVLLDSIISEEILHEASRATRGRYAGNRQANRYTGNRQQPQNLQQKRQQNTRQAQVQPQQQATAPQQQQTTQQVQNTQPQTQQPQSTQQPQNTQQPQQGQQPQQATPQGQQQPAADFSQYADELRRLIGNSGFDATPVENNQAATQHIEKLNQFVFAVINAIDNGNINAASSPAAGGGSSYSRWGKPYSKDGVDVAMDATNGIVGFTTDTAEKFLGQGSNNPFNGVFKAGGDAYKKTKGDIANYMNQKKYANSYGNSTTPQGANGGTDLTYLMQSIDEGCYPRLQSEYNQINQGSNGIFGATPNVSNCHEVLRSLASAVTNYNNNQKQATQQQQGGQQPAQNTTQPAKPKQAQPAAATTAPSTATPAPGVTKPAQQTKPAQAQLSLKSVADNLRRIDSNGNRISALIDELEQKTLVHGREVDYHVQDNDTTTCITTIKGIGDLSDSVIEAIDNNSIYPADKNKTGITPLTELMSLGRYNSSFNNYDSVKYAYENNSSKYRVLRDSTLKNLMSELDRLYKKMKSLGIQG